MENKIKCEKNSDGTMLICKAFIGNPEIIGWNDIPLGIKVFTFAFMIVLSIIILSAWYYVVDRWIDNGNMTITQKNIMAIAIYLAFIFFSRKYENLGMFVGLLIWIIIIIFIIEYLTGKYILPEKKFI